MASEDLPANGHGGPADPKFALRQALRAARAAYAAGLTTIGRDALEAALAATLADYLPPGVVAGYHAIGSEIGLARFDRITLAPRVVGSAPLVFHSGPVIAGRTVAGLGILAEPHFDAPQETPDIVLVPLLAVDRLGNRLGQGGGYYDRTLSALRRVRPVFAVGVAWDMQLVDCLPVDPWDAPLDALATPSQWLTFPVSSPMSPR